MVDGLSGICSSRGCGEVQIYFQLDTPEPGTGGDPSDYIPLRNATDREIIFTPRESEHSRVPAHPPASAPTLVSAVEQRPVPSSIALRRPLGGPALAVAFLIYLPSVSTIVAMPRASIRYS